MCERAMRGPRVVELVGVPRPMAGGALESVVIANGFCVALVYEVFDRERPRAEAFAAVLFACCMQYLGGGPNDEAYGNHPFFENGLQPYAAQEVVGSPWIEERGRINDKDGTFDWDSNTLRHFVFVMKEDLFECLADEMQVIGVFEGRDEAVRVAMRSVGLAG